jgi:hypothetical protein
MRFPAAPLKRAHLLVAKPQDEAASARISATPLRTESTIAGCSDDQTGGAVLLDDGDWEQLDRELEDSNMRAS